MFMLVIFLSSSEQKNFANTPNIYKLNDRPIIAILAQDVWNNDVSKPRRSYIAASYVKFIEASGARVVPIPSHLSQDKVEEIFNGVNGVLFPGGGINWNTSGYFKHAQYFFKRGMEEYENGDYFPIWGTCLGFETLHVIAAGDGVQALSSFSASDISLPLRFTEQANTSRIFGSLPHSLRRSLETENITYNHHSYGVSPTTYLREKSLRNFFKVLSTNEGKKGKTFISSVEGLFSFLYVLLHRSWLRYFCTDNLLYVKYGIFRFLFFWLPRLTYCCCIIVLGIKLHLQCLLLGTAL